jgi:hypothetical protein
LGNWVFRQKPQLPNYPINCFENPNTKAQREEVDELDDRQHADSCKQAEQSPYKSQKVFGFELLVSDEREIFAVSVSEFQVHFVKVVFLYIFFAVFFTYHFNFVLDRVACWQAITDSIRGKKMVEVFQE